MGLPDEVGDLFAAFFRVVDGHCRALGQAFAGFGAQFLDAPTGFDNGMRRRES
jgi:hypothetical protein